MSTADVIVLPGIERRDIVGEPLDSRHVLQAAIDLGITDVVIVGRHRNGELYVAGAPNDVDRSAGLLMRGAWFLSSGTYNQGIVGDAKPPDESA